ncbi:MAG: ribulose-phosphate 3-epimerase [Patescibacteria group bacterium]
MIEIIPTIIAKDFQELKEKIGRVELYVNWAQLDVMDGQFVSNSTWPYIAGKNNPADLKNLETNLKLEVHLMVKQPEEVIDDWLDSGVKRIIFHYEATDKHKEIIDKIKKAGLEVGIAINPETPIEVLAEFLNVSGSKFQVSLILIMTVEPGQGGQGFLDYTLFKIKKLRESYPDVKIEVDGGINFKTAPQVIKAGANLLASGTAIFNSSDIKEAINRLKKA